MRVALLLVAAFAFSSCSMLSANGRQQAAYNRYVRQHALARQKRTVKYGKPQKVEAPQPTDDTIAAGASGPQAVGDGSEQ